MKTIKKLVAITFILLGAIAIAQAQIFVVNKNQSTVKWNGKKVGGEHYGTIKFNNGSLQLNNGQISTAVFEIDMNSIVCDDITNEGSNQRLVNHLKSDDFFSVSTHPTSRFSLSRVRKLSGNEFEYTGNMTIKGITHPVTFNATTEVNGSTLRASGTMVIDRAKFDVRFGSGSFFQNLGERLIYDDFTLDFNIVANTQ